MPRMFHSVAVQEKAVAADGVEVFDLAVNPLSVVFLAIRPLNETSTLSNYARYLSIVGSLDRVTINHRGSAVLNASGRDIAAMNWARRGCLPREMNAVDTDNDRRCVVLPIYLGRFPHDSKSCFPASKRGELTMELAIDVADTGYDGFRYSVETAELLDASPSEYERVTTMSQTFASTGDQIFPLPSGNTVRGLLLFGTTGFGGASPAPTWGRTSVYLDNQQIGVSSTDFEVAAMMPALHGRQIPAIDDHIHRVDATAANANQASLGPSSQGRGGWENYAFLDLDPTRDDEFSLDTSRASSFQLRANVETADAARVVMIEKISI